MKGSRNKAKVFISLHTHKRLLHYYGRYTYGEMIIAQVTQHIIILHTNTAS
jgi:hypothetical protein